MNDGFKRPRTILVLGGTSEIGGAVVDAVLRDGGAVVLAGRDPDALRRTGAGLNRPARTVDLLRWDVTDDVEATVAVVDAACRLVGDLDVVVLAVGALADEADLDRDTAAVAEQVRVNLCGPLVAVHAVTNRLRAQGHGTLVVLSSASAVRPRAELLTYGIAKSALDLYARRLAPVARRDGARILVVRPGQVRTRMTRGRPEPPLTIDPAQVATVVGRALRGRRPVVYAPAAVGVVAAVLRLLPTRVLDRLAVQRGPRRRRRRGLLVILAVLVALLATPAYSYIRALTYPGSATFQMRTADWARSHGGGPIVNAIENWYYSRHKPGNRPNPTSLPTVQPSTGPATPAAPDPPRVAVPVSTPLPGEGTWVPGRRDGHGTPALYTTFVRPDAGHQSVVAGIAWIRAADTAGHLVAGTTQPSTGWPGPAAVPAGDVASLVATFNSGFKMADSRGGFYLDGRTGRPLVDGQASVVIDSSGHVTVGQWGRDVTMTPNVVAVRQSLALVVDRGQPVDGLADNADGRWGSARNQYQYTWRSGIGVDAHGNLVYVAGDKMNLATLAATMVDAGVVRGMELDIHPGMASFASWQADPGQASRPTKLLPDMPRSAWRYLSPDQRDFFYVTVRSN